MGNLMGASRVAAHAARPARLLRAVLGCVLLAVAAGACGGASVGDSPTPGITVSATAPGSDQQPDASGDGGATTRGDIVLHARSTGS